MLYQIQSYIKFLLRSTNHHGVHSPFVFALLTKCFYDKSAYPEYEALRAHRNTFLSSTEKLEVTDLGSGSRVFSSNTRNVSGIAKNAGISRKRQRLLFRLTRYLKPELMLELGTSLGLATAAMSLGHPAGQLITIEGCPNTANKAKEEFRAFQLKNIRVRNESFKDFFTSLDLATFTVIYVDGNHDKDNTLAYFDALLKYVDNESVIIFDDIYWSQGMTEAWQEIAEHPKVTVSIDTFFWGLVFFRKEQQKEHFTIRL